LNAEPANSAHSGQALIKTDKTTIHPTSIVATIILRAPRIVLGFGATSGDDETGENSYYEQQALHGSLLATSWCPSLISQYRAESD
jgi:hypothetical protein